MPPQLGVVGRRPILSTILILSAVLVAGCGTISTTPPVAAPADFAGIAAEFARRGVQVDRFVSGDAGCPDPVLTPTAIAFDARGLDQADNVRIYIYIFRNREAFERLRASVDTCAVAFVTDAQTFESAEESPFVLAGQGPWAPEFETALRDGLAAAAGTGG